MIFFLRFHWQCTCFYFPKRKFSRFLNETTYTYIQFFQYERFTFGDKKFSFINFEEVYDAIYTHTYTIRKFCSRFVRLQIEAFENFDCLKRLKIWLSYLNRKGNIKLFLISNWRKLFHTQANFLLDQTYRIEKYLSAKISIVM